ncbi:hypothetical protein NQ315_010853 [Exocentrus adspersus]|uniref:Uncharacterized protein n=1 Tax=Exocentrus adspersus TaxID=1586481 RepID=A0AAV8VBV5_9CUCU|nr:hypothetical protein NQ315_010853 [Exocentrus adspersus]
MHEWIGGVNRGKVSEWRKERELEKWQEIWDEGRTGRWLHELWPQVNRRGCESVSVVLAQVATGHGAFGAYLSRFRLSEEDGGYGAKTSISEFLGLVHISCEADDVRHAVLDCMLPHRREARDRMTERIGRYPPRLNEVRKERWQDVLNWVRQIVTGESGGKGVRECEKGRLKAGN